MPTSDSGQPRTTHCVRVSVRLAIYTTEARALMLNVTSSNQIAILSNQVVLMANRVILKEADTDELETLTKQCNS